MIDDLEIFIVVSNLNKYTEKFSKMSMKTQV